MPQTAQRINKSSGSIYKSQYKRPQHVQAGRWFEPGEPVIFCALIPTNPFGSSFCCHCAWPSPVGRLACCMQRPSWAAPRRTTSCRLSSTSRRCMWCVQFGQRTTLCGPSFMAAHMLTAMVMAGFRPGASGGSLRCVHLHA